MDIPEKPVSLSPKAPLSSTTLSNTTAKCTCPGRDASPRRQVQSGESSVWGDFATTGAGRRLIDDYDSISLEGTMTGARAIRPAHFQLVDFFLVA